MTTRASPASLAFLDGDSEMALAMRTYDWAKSPIGSPQTWPQSLRTAVRLMLTTRHPMYIWWGPELVCLYNDAYRQSIGPERHPGSLGQPARAVWDEIWDIIGPQIEQVMAGRGATWHENALVPITRNGQREEVYWTYSYSPIDDEASATGVGGVLVVCSETTATVMADQRRTADADRQRRMFEQAPSFVCIMEGPDHTYSFVNNAHRRLFNSGDWIGKPLREAFPDLAGQGFYEIMDQVYATGERFVAKAAVVRFRAGPGAARQDRRLDFIYEPMRDDDGQVTGIFCEGFDVTEAWDAEQDATRNQARQQLMLNLLRGQRETEDADAIMTAAVTALGNYLGIDRAGFYEMDGDDTIVFGTCWHSERLGPLSGPWPAANIGTRYLAAKRAGYVPGISNVTTDPLAVDSKFADIGVHAAFAASIVRSKSWVGGIYVHHSQPRVWSDDDIALIRDVADQTWDAVQRARAVADQRAAQEALRRSEEQLRLATDHGEIGLWDVDLVNGELFWQPRVKQMYGMSPDETPQTRYYSEGLHPDDREQAMALFTAARDPDRRAPYDAEYRTVGREDGIVRWVSSKGRGIFDDNGTCVRMIGVATDITKRKQAEIALRELNETLEHRVTAVLAERRILADIVESTDAMVQMVDTNFTWLAVNLAMADEFERIYGVRPRVGANMLEALDALPDHRDAVRSLWIRALAGEEFTTIAEFGALDRRQYEIKFNILRNAEGHKIGAYQFVHDVTERLRDQARLTETEDHLRQAQKIEAIGQLTGGVAHDFNNLLMVISGGLSILERQADPERRQRILDGMRQAAERGASLTRQLLAFSRRQPLRPEPVDLARGIDSMRELLDRTLSGDVLVETRFAAGLWPVIADPAELELVVLNLCVNARDAMPQGGRITISADNVDDFQRGDLSGNFVRLGVADTGTGMSKDVLARVFEPFFTTKEVGKGSGLGLAQVYGFARQSGGLVEIDSTPGEGTRVTLFLPRSDTTPVSAPVISDTDASADRRSNGLVLLVEDDDEVATLVSEMLLHLGYEVTRTASAQAALGALANDRPVDIVFSDIMMPGGMNGIELAREIRRRRPGLPILLTSGHPEAVRRDAQAERIELLPKPYEIKTLSASLSRVARPAAAATLSRVELP